MPRKVPVEVLRQRVFHGYAFLISTGPNSRCTPEEYDGIKHWVNTGDESKLSERMRANVYARGMGKDQTTTD